MSQTISPSSVQSALGGQALPFEPSWVCHSPNACPNSWAMVAWPVEHTFPIKKLSSNIGIVPAKLAYPLARNVPVASLFTI
nr:hypothetical protein [Chryseobacterium balustinum]